MASTTDRSTVAKTSGTPPLGSHMSIAGGHYRAVEAAQQAGCDCVQLFTKNSNQWRAKPIAPADAERFRSAVAAAGFKHTLSHDSYLINLAAPDDVLWKKSIEAFVDEMQRAEQLGIPYVVTHPGAFTTSSEDAGLTRIAQGLDRAFLRLKADRQTESLQPCCLLETTAGQGSTLGWRFEQLAEILRRVEHREWLGVCVDTCHIFAAGYPLQTPAEYADTMGQLDKIVGLELVRAFHLNDSQKPLGSRVDRHAHIGEGALGLEPFRHLLNDPRFATIPMYLETEKGERDGEDLDRMNLRILRGLVGA